MRRWAFAILSALCLVLCLLTAMEWVRSYWRVDAIGYGGRWKGGEVSLVEGKLHLWTWTTDDPSYRLPAPRPGFSFTSGTTALAYRLPGGRSLFSFSFAGVYSHTYRVGGSASINDIWYFYVPCWEVVLGTAIAPAMWVCIRYRNRQARMRRLGLCPKCGYDLRASAERCPECGRPVPMRPG